MTISTRRERKPAFAEVSRALEASRDSYLQEVRQYLYNDEQFALLRNYENHRIQRRAGKAAPHGLRRMMRGVQMTRGMKRHFTRCMYCA